jgi:hypothetical protein
MSGSRAYFLTTVRLGFDWWSNADLALANALWGDPKVTALIGGPFTGREVLEKLRREIASSADYKVQYWPRKPAARPSPLRSKHPARKPRLPGIILQTRRRFMS